MDYYSGPLYSGPLAFALLTTLAACEPAGSSPQDDYVPESTTLPQEELPPDTGLLALSFAIDPGASSDLDEPAVGTFYGGVYWDSDVTIFGPKDGAPELEAIQVDIDLRTADGTTAVLYTSSPLQAGEVNVLGFVDTDHNADSADPQPETGDPVTLPWDNVFTVTVGEKTTAQVFLGMLNP